MTDTPAAPAPAPAAATPAPTGEEAELLALHARDPLTFEHYRGQDGTEATGAEKLLALRRARQAAEKPDPQQAEQPEADALADGDADPDVLADDTDGEETDDAGEPEVSEADLQYDREDFTYTPPDGAEVTELGQERISAFAEFAHKSNMAPEIYEGAINWYNQLVATEQARLAEADKTARAELVANLKGELGDGYAAFRSDVDGAFRELPQELRTALRSARLPDGRLLLSMPEAVHMVRSLAQPGSQQSQSTFQPRDSRSAMQQELAEIDALMHSDIDQYHKRWRATGMSASERRLQIMRELASEGPAKPSAADLSAERRQLEQLKSRDPQLFQFGSWPGARSPADRLHQIQAGRG